MSAAAGALGDALGRALGARVVETRRVPGGDINDAWAARLDDGRRVFVKTRPDAPAAMFAAEAAGLAWLAEARALRVPGVIACPGPDSRGPYFLALELIEPGPRRSDFDVELGRGLAALHRAGAASFGLSRPGFIGTLPQPNDPRDTWPEFYRALRLEPLARRALDRGRLDPVLARRFELLYARLDELAGPPEPPARLHGDLWGGNLHVDPDGRPCLIDPAAYGGHREIDLAMMRLFGGFGARVFDAYAEAHPPAPGHDERIALYQLYPLLVHVNLFGGAYAASVEAALRRYA